MKTIIINQVEYELEQHDNGKMLSEIKIPKGWRLLWPSEAMMLYERGLIDKSFWFYVKQINKKLKSRNYTARFIAGSGGAFLACGGYSTYTGSSLGVIFARDFEVKDE